MVSEYLQSSFIVFFVKGVPWSLDTKAYIPKVRNTGLSRFLATVKTVAFRQRNVSRHLEIL